jgi:hypothetical protein
MHDNFAFPVTLSSPERVKKHRTNRDKARQDALKIHDNFAAAQIYTQDVGGSSPSPPTTDALLAASWRASV